MNCLTNEEKIKLYIEDRKYDFSILKIINMKQVALYTHHDVMPIDMICNDGKLCFIYNKKDTLDIFAIWNENKSKNV